MSTTFDMRPLSDPRVRAGKGITSSMALSVGGHVVVLVGMLVGNAVWSGIFPPAPLVDTQTMEVSMVVLAHTDKAHPDKAMRAPTPKGVETPTPTPPEPSVQESDLQFQVDKPLPAPVKGDPNAADKRAAELAKMERERMLQDLTAAEGDHDQDATDPHSTSDFGMNTGAQGDPTDPEYARYIKQLQNLFMQYFHPLPGIGASNPGIRADVFIEVDPDTGKVVSYKMRKASGNASYDNAAEIAVQSVPTIPKPPPKYEALMKSGYVIQFTPPTR